MWKMWTWVEKGVLQKWAKTLHEALCLLGYYNYNKNIAGSSRCIGPVKLLFDDSHYG